MSKIQVSTLTDEKLDYWVAKANGESPYIKQYFDGTKQCWIESADSPYSPSTNPAQAFLIIERERIGLMAEEEGSRWMARRRRGDLGYLGSTPLIAAMRCFVASKFGEAVDE